jgi:hypothetical protein
LRDLTAQETTDRIKAALKAAGIKAYFSPEDGKPYFSLLP